MPRFKKKIDANQKSIVEALRKIPGVTVALDHDDVLVGYKGKTFWYEVKNPDVIGKDGVVRDSAKKESQKKLESSWTGHYRIVWNLDQILDEILRG